MVRSIKTGLRF